MPPITWALKKAKRLIIAIVGLTVMGIGIAMIVLPGPAIVVIPIGLGILVTRVCLGQEPAEENQGPHPQADKKNNLRIN